MMVLKVAEAAPLARESMAATQADLTWSLAALEARRTIVGRQIRR